MPQKPSTQLIFGIHPVTEFLQIQPQKCRQLYIIEAIDHKPIQKIIALAKKANVRITTVDKPYLSRITHHATHQGVALLAEPFEFTPLSELLKPSPNKKESHFFLLLDSIQDPNNLGALMRTADAAGIDAVILPQDRSCPISSTVIKASAGAVMHKPIVQVVNLARTIDQLKQENIWVYGAALNAKESLYDLDLSGNIAIVLGNEGAGLRALVQKKCDLLFSIPQKGQIQSLNVSAAGAVILYEAVRQRLIKRA